MTTSPPVQVEFVKMFNVRCWLRRARAADSAHGASHTLTGSSMLTSSEFHGANASCKLMTSTLQAVAFSPRAARAAAA